MRTSKMAALVALLAGLVWVAAGVLARGGDGLDPDAERLWWAGLGVFALASALAGYAGATKAPLWLKVVVFVGAGALGGSVLATVDTQSSSADLVALGAGALLVLVGLIALVTGRRTRQKPEPPVRGRRAAR